jgi:hypothetical protein
MPRRADGRREPHGHGDSYHRESTQKEDTMPTTLIDTCPLCGLRFGSRPLLELHIRDDHPPALDHEEDGRQRQVRTVTHLKLTPEFPQAAE